MKKVNILILFLKSEHQFVNRYKKLAIFFKNDNLAFYRLNK